LNGDGRTATCAPNPQLEVDFPNLAASGYQITSCSADEPNCIGWALNDGRCWDPLGVSPGTHFYRWLNDLGLDFKVDTISELFSRHSYIDCADGTLESGYEKIAMYYDISEGEISHVARQLPDGRWTSKLGPGEDIEHNDLHALEGDTTTFPLCYGLTIKFMRRPRP
jgi:hypothetical protein